MSKASTELLEQGTQTPSPAPDLIPAETKKQPRTHIRIGTANGGTSLTLPLFARYKQLANVKCRTSGLPIGLQGQYFFGTPLPIA